MSGIPRFAKFLLIPFSFVYGLILDLRNVFYDLGWFRSYRFHVPVISIGNLTLGGTGKTPFTIFLAETLSAEFNKIAIISRGYGRSSKGLQVVADGEDVLLGSEQGGDEPVLIASRLPGKIVIVSENRAQGISHALQAYQPDLIILDDAFQHRKVRRDVNILLINSGEEFARNYPVPAGTLREFRHNYKRADIVILTNASLGPVLYNFGDKPVFKITAGAHVLVNADLRPSGRLTDLTGKKVVAFAGIAHPQNFLNTLQSAGLIVSYFRRFSDHQKYQKSDLDQFLKIAKDHNCSHIMCTEKDLVKVRELFRGEKLFSGQHITLLALRLQPVVEHREKLINIIGELLDNKR